MGTVRLPDQGAHHYEQIHAELLVALRKERKGFFVQVAGDDIESPVFGFYVSGTGGECSQFLEDVIASAQAELAEIDRRIQDDE